MARNRGDGSPFGISYGYLEQTATPGGTMTRQGPATALGRLHPTFAQRLEAAIREARAAGIPAGVYSAYRPVGMGVGGFRNKYNSLHTYGAAVDITGIGRPGSSTSRRWYEIATKHGLHNPYGPNHGAEWNHYQLIPDKVAPASWRQFVDANGPVDQEAMWQAVMPYQAGQQGVTPDTIRMAQEYLNQNGFAVPVTGQMDDGTVAGLRAFDASPGGAAFAQKYGLQRPAMAQERAFQPQPSQAPAQAAINDALLDTRPQRSVPGAYRVDAQPYRGAAPGTNPADMLQPAAATARPPVQMQIGPGQQATLPSLMPPDERVAFEQRLYDAAPGKGDFDAPIMLDEFEVQGTLAPMPTLTPQGTPTIPRDPGSVANNALMIAGRQPQVNPVADYMAQQAEAFRDSDRVNGIPVMPPLPPVQPQAGVPAEYAPPANAMPFPRPNPIPVAQRGRAGRTPNGYQWSHIPQRGGPTMLAVVTPQGRRWSTPLGPPGGAGLFNEFASSFTPVIRG